MLGSKRKHATSSLQVFLSRSSEGEGLPAALEQDVGLLFNSSSPGSADKFACYRFDDPDVSLRQVGLWISIDENMGSCLWTRKEDRQVFFNNSKRLRGEEGRGRQATAMKVAKNCMSDFRAQIFRLGCRFWLFLVFEEIWEFGCR